MTHNSPYAYYLRSSVRFKKDKQYHLLVLYTDKITVTYCETKLHYRNEDELLKDWKIVEE